MWLSPFFTSTRKIRYMLTLKQFSAAVVKRCNQTQNELFAELEWQRFCSEDSYGTLGMGVTQRGAPVLAVAHTDVVVNEYASVSRNGKYIHSGCLDDRLGCAIILDLLPSMGIEVDILFTDGEEIGCSTAQDFETNVDYNWMVEFDRRGLDVVTYEYGDDTLRSLLRSAGFTSFDGGTVSDISYLEDLGIKGFNVGVDYHGEHTQRCYANLENTMKQVQRFANFYHMYSDLKLTHVKSSYSYWGSSNTLNNYPTRFGKSTGTTVISNGRTSVVDGASTGEDGKPSLTRDYFGDESDYEAYKDWWYANTDAEDTSCEIVPTFRCLKCDEEKSIQEESFTVDDICEACVSAQKLNNEYKQMLNTQYDEEGSL